MKMIDMSHYFDDKMPVYPGDDRPTIRQIACIDANEYNEYCYCGGMHVGTHIDAPLHMIKNGRTIADIALGRFLGRGVLIDARGSISISAELLVDRNIHEGDIVVVLTGWYNKFHNEDYFGAFPRVEQSFAERLVELKPSILALDTPSPDDHPFPVHKTLLSNDILIIENLANVEPLLEFDRFDIIAIPPKFTWDGAPVRVVATSSREFDCPTLSNDNV